MAERMVQVPVSLIRQALDDCFFPMAPGVKDQFRALLSQPPRIEDMAPGTTFRARFVNGTADRHFEFTATTIPVRLIPSRLTYWPSDIDPSTIRDVTPPTESTK